MSSDKSISMRRDQSAPKADIDIADLVEEGVAVFDLNLVVSFWSDAAERIYGWKREEVIGGAIQDAVQCSPSQPLNVILDQVHRSGEWRGEIVRTTKNGGIVVVSTKWSLRRGADGEPLDIVETSRNITDAKAAEAALERSERRYREFFHFLPIALFQLDRKGLPAVLAKPRSEGVTDLIAYARTRPDFVANAMDALQVVEVNRRAVDMLRGTSPDDFKGSVAPNWTESLEIFVDCLAAAYRGQKTYEAQIKIKARDGTILDVLFFAAFSPVTGEQDITLLAMIDVSDRARAEAMLTQMQSEIAHASRVSVLGELTASIAHEVSQPLTAIESNTEASLLWLQRSPPNIDEVRELSARTAAEVQRAAEIIQRVRSMAVRSTPEFAEVSVNPLIEEAILFLRHELQRNEIETSLHLDPKLPEIIGDRIQLQQVIVNLVVNAVQATTTAKLGMRRLDITTSMNPSDEVLIVVRDTGPGISDEIRDRLFESFFTTKSSGMGIGLTICRSIIEAHGGRISVANRADETGAQFSIVLPSSYQRKHPAS